MKPLLSEPGSCSRSCARAAFGQVCQECPLAVSSGATSCVLEQLLRRSRHGCVAPLNLGSEVQEGFLLLFHFKAVASEVCSQLGCSCSGGTV